MKKVLCLLSFCLLGLNAYAQENIFTLSGGYAFAKPENYSSTANGFRINGLYEFNKGLGMFAHGFSFGYIGTSLEIDGLSDNTTISINSIPLYYAPKFMFGKDKFKGFVKGALGAHIFNYKYTGNLIETKSSDIDFYGGIGLGAMFFINQDVFINLEYEWAYMGNGYYSDGFINTVQLGVGYRF
jgi:hypothetical protein